MTAQVRGYGHLIATVTLTFAGLGTATAAPGIQAVYTDYTVGGAPLSLNIVGSGFTCADCGPPRVSLGGLSLTVKAHSAKVITAVLPQPLAAGDYTLAVTTGLAPRDEVARFSLSVASAPVAATSVVTVPTVRSASSGSGPAPGLKRPADLATRPAGPLSRNSTNSVKTTVVGADGQMKGGTSVATNGATPNSTPGGIYLPEYSTAFGDYAMYKVSTGLYDTTTRANSAFGYAALLNTTDGSYNNAFGFYSLYSNINGGDNNAFGNWTLLYNTTGTSNNAFGHQALYSNTTGNNNSAFGHEALYSNSTGANNTASGINALYFNTTGGYNTASGYRALYSNTTGASNTASGFGALFSNTTGGYNTAVGIGALASNTSGSWNTALGENAGYNATTGNNNIYIGSEVRGLNTDNAVIRLGNSAVGYKTYIAGIRGVTTGLAGAVTVLVDANGQLGTISSSRRYKEDIKPMGGMSERLFALRPVTFRYKKPYEDGSKPVQFGLIAEEVAEVLPELAVYGKNGQPETVSYHLLATLLLNEVQKDHRVMQAQADQLAALRRDNETQAIRMAALEQQVAVLAKAVGRTEKDRMVAAAR